MTFDVGGVLGLRSSWNCGVSWALLRIRVWEIRCVFFGGGGIRAWNCWRFFFIRVCFHDAWSWWSSLSLFLHSGDWILLNNLCIVWSLSWRSIQLWFFELWVTCAFMGHEPEILYGVLMVNFGVAAIHYGKWMTYSLELSGLTWFMLHNVPETILLNQDF